MCDTCRGKGCGALQEPRLILFWASETSAHPWGSERLWGKGEHSGMAAKGVEK